MSRIIIIILLQLSTLTLMAQEWIVPADRKGRLSPFAFSEDTRRAGEKLYTLNCLSCHGNPGKGNFTKLVPPPGDPATDKIQHNSDGEIFFKITTGRGPMPSFKNALAANDMWNVISYLRSFNPKYVQSVMQIIKSAAYPGAVIGISLSLDREKNNVLMKVIAAWEKKTVPVTNAGVKLFAKRTFGYEVIDEEKNTDSSGIAVFSISRDFPGDSIGNINFSARFTDEDKFGPFSKDTTLAAGKVTITESLLKNRAMWNNVRKAPVWVILTYGLGVLGVWAFIIYVLLHLRDIFIIGEHLTKKEK